MTRFGVDDEETAPDHIERATDELGFDPRRFFDEPLLSTQQGAIDPVERMASIIRGIDKKRRVAALITVERRLDRGPRDEVLSMLRERMAYLDEHGERTDLRTASLDERPARFHPVDRDVPEKEVYAITSDDERVRWADRPTGVSVGRKFESSASADEVATDGGERE